ncbi:MAG: BatD family protein [Candidatus Hydrogenedentota bacterium]
MPRWRLAFILLAVPLAAAFSDEESLQVYLSDETVQVGQYFRLIVKSDSGKITDVNIPAVDGLSIERRPSIQKSSFQSVSGKTEASTVLGFAAVASREGVIKIPPVTVTVDGEKVRSEPLEVRVVASDGKRSVFPPGRKRTEDDVTYLRADDVAFIETEVDKKEVYVGEPVSLTLRYYRLDNRSVRVSVPSGGIEYTFPDAEGFYRIPERPKEIEGGYAENDQRRYRVTQWRQTLFATEPRDLEIPPWEWEAVVQARTVHGINSLRLELATEPIPIKAKPLPKRPPNFNGAVGRFSFKAQVAPQVVKQNMPVTLIIRVTGTGNPAAIGAPRLAPLENAHLSEPERAIEPIADPEGVTAETTFSYQITPLKPGSLAIPSIEFCYFDPVKEQFLTEKTQSFIVTVEASGERDRRYVAGTVIEPETDPAGMLNGQLMPIVTARTKLHRNSFSKAGIALALVCPPFGYGLIVLWTARKRRFSEDRIFARAYRAKSRMRKRLRGVPDAADPADALYHAINGYLADKFDLPEAGMTSADARDLFEGRAIEHEAADKLLKILRYCERGRYAGEELSRDAVVSLVHVAEENMGQLDRWLEKESR